ncbi:MAG: alpha-amylase family glycosyl hydrolase [Acidimicrobiia bacterium]
MAGGRDGAHAWWTEAVFYQIYPLSFADSDGDGYGDLDGIIGKLDYLSETLGVDALWLSPFFESPMADWGYDISDHTAVDPLFGDLSTAERLIEEAHGRGLRVIVDYVINHTSDRHRWFIESGSSRDSTKRDWYIWRDPKPDGSPPNNWVSVFSGPAWTYDETTGQYYRHTFLPNQPDLNWRNPDVVEAMLDVARFWLERGVDGFRVDAAHQMMKDPLERDNPPVPQDHLRPWKDMGEYDHYLHLYDYGHPDVHEAHRTFRKVLDSYSQDPMSVGEVHIFDLPEWASYYGFLDELHTPFNFHLMASKWDAASLRAVIESVLWNVPVGGWANWTLGNHDEIRLASRLGDRRTGQAALLLLTLRGTPFLYYGDEIGMKEVTVGMADRRDPWGHSVDYLCRDGARTPMQWDRTANAGFSPEGSSDPWLPVADDAGVINIETQLEQPESLLNLYRRLLGLRRESTALRRGSLLMHPASTDQVLVYRRESDDETMTIAINFSEQTREVAIRSGRVVFSTSDPGRSEPTHGGLSLEALEGVVISHTWPTST